MGDVKTILEQNENPSQTVKLFGMPAEKGRWVFVIFGLIINFILGSIYSWSVFRLPLQKLFAVDATASLLPYIIFLALLSMGVLFSGGPLDKYGPRNLTILGGIMVGIGWILASQSTSMTMLTLAYGIIAGAGVGIAYSVPIGLSGRWFPDKRGLAVGLTVLGFGLSPLVTAPLANLYISSYGVLPTLEYFGIVSLIVIVLLGLPLRFPSAEWKPSGWEPKASAIQCDDLTRPEMIRTKGFWGLWLCFMIGTLAGLMAIGISSPVGQEVFALNAATAAALTGVFAIFGGIGRPIFGYLVDRINPRNTAMVSFGIIFLAAAFLGFGAAPGATALYVAGFGALWLCLGGWVTIAPACTAAYCGTKYYGSNYGLVYTAFGVGAIIGNLLAGRLRDIVGSYVAVFYPVAILALIGIALAYLLIRHPSEARARAPSEWFRVLSRVVPSNVALPQEREVLPVLRQPSLDVLDAGTDYKVQVDLPGLKKKGLSIELTPDSIEISAESTMEKEESKEGEYLSRERGYSAFKRVVPFPMGILPTKAVAKFEDGVLEVVLPKSVALPQEREVLPVLRQPSLDVLDAGTDYKVQVDLPGLKKEGLSIELTPDSIEISAESTMEKEESKEGEYLFRERGYSAFKRVVPFPMEILPTKAVAKFEDGVLEVVLPKKKSTPAPKKVKLKLK